MKVVCSWVGLIIEEINGKNGDQPEDDKINQDQKGEDVTDGLRFILFDLGEGVGHLD